MGTFSFKTSWVLALGICLCSISQADSIRCHDLFSEGLNVTFKYSYSRGNFWVFGDRTKLGTEFESPSNYSWLIPIEEQAPVSQVKEMSISKKSRAFTHARGEFKGFGTGEQMVSLVHSNFLLFLENTLQRATESEISPSERGWYQEIIDLFRNHRPPINFQDPEEFGGGSSGSLDPHRIAKTSISVPGAAIDFNTNAFRTLYKEEKAEPIKIDWHSKNAPVAPGLESPAPYNARIKPKDLLDSTSVDRLVQIFSVMIHELGHQKGELDTEDRSLDQKGAKLAGLFRKYVSEFTFSEVDHPWIKILSVRFDYPVANGVGDRVFLIESTTSFDITDSLLNALKERLGSNIERFWIYDLRIENTKTWEDRFQSSPISLMGTAYVTRKDSHNIEEVPLRLVSYIGPSDVATDLYNGPHWWNIGTGLRGGVVKKHWGLLFGVQLLEQRKRSKETIATFTSINQKVGRGQSWQSSVEVDFEGEAEIETVEAKFTSERLIWAGFIKRHKELFSEKAVVTKLARPGGYRIDLRHHNDGQTQTGEYFIDSVDITFRDGSRKTIRPRNRDPITLLGMDYEPLQVIHYGNEATTIWLKAGYKGPPPILKFRSQVQALLPIEFQFNRPFQAKRILLTGHFNLIESDGNPSTSGFFIDLLKDQSHPLVREVNLQRDQHNRSISVLLRSPDQVNNRKVHSIEIHSLYVMDNHLVESNNSVPTAYRIERPSGP